MALNELNLRELQKMIVSMCQENKFYIENTKRLNKKEDAMWQKNSTEIQTLKKKLKSWKLNKKKFWAKSHQQNGSRKTKNSWA